MKVVVPLRTGTGQNDREHFRARARRVKHERLAVAWMLAVHKPLTGPVTVTLCRVSPGNGLDAHDNLRGSLKAPVDQVAEWLGRDDRDPSITWAYEQRRGKPGEWLVSIEVKASLAERNGQAEGVRPGCIQSIVLLGVDAEAPVKADGVIATDHMDLRSPAVTEHSRSGKKRDTLDVNRHVHVGHIRSGAEDCCQTKAIHSGDAG